MRSFGLRTQANEMMPNEKRIPHKVDDAFKRRIDAALARTGEMLIHQHVPGDDQRRKGWCRQLRGISPSRAQEVDLEQLAHDLGCIEPWEYLVFD